MSEGSVGIGLIGYGAVGSGVGELLTRHAARYEQRAGRALRVERVLVRDASRPRSGLDPERITDDPERLLADPAVDVVVEVAGGVEDAKGYLERAIDAGKHVVTANKALLSAHGPELFERARAKGVALAFEASCAAGMPVVTALSFGLMANRIQGLYGILNGTCNYILTEMTRGGKTYDAALAEAQEKQYAEADPTLDVSGRDAAQKLAILASLAFGAEIDETAVVCRGIDGLALEDIGFGAELGYDIRLLAIAESRDDGSLSLRVEPCFIDRREPLAQVQGSFNALSVYGDAVGHSLYYGRGAGSLPTASAVVGDLINVAAGWYPRAFARMGLWPGRNPRAEVASGDALASRFFVRIDALDVPGTMARVSRILGEAGISLSAILQHEAAAGQFVPVVICTHEARQGDLTRALAAIEALDEVEGAPVWIRIVDMPAG